MAEAPVHISPSRLVGYDVARQSPCSSCPSWCCTRLPLHNFWIRNLVEFDHARYLLNFEHVELGLAQSGEWSAHYVAPCRQLTGDLRCSVHGTPQQPIVCTTYNEHSCWYRRVLPGGVHDEFVRIDLARMAVLVEHIKFDDAGLLAEMPPWATLPDLFASLEVDNTIHANGAAPPVPVTVTASAASPAERRRSALTVLNGDPCEDCSAYCCSTLIFPVTTPANVGGLDYLRFALGFPGVEAVVSDESWSLAVHTRCRHLDGTRCAVYGQPERPMVCSHYDARTCHYRMMFGPIESPTTVRVRFEQLDRLFAAVEIEPDGAVVALPTVDELRKIVRAAPG